MCAVGAKALAREDLTGQDEDSQLRRRRLNENKR